MAYALGVDLGTTWTAAAVLVDDVAQPLSLSGRGFSVSSVVARDGDGFVVGEAAERRLRAAPASGAREMKRRLGDPAPFVLDSAPYGAEALIGQLLAHVVAVATETQGEAPSTVVLTHPATWGEYKLDLLREAGRVAGVVEVLLVSEPEAAAAHYAGLGRVEPGDIVAVYDFGGGTFDAAVVRRTGAGFELLGEPQGLDRLGGVDLDQAVLAHVDRALGGVFGGLDRGDPAVVAGLVRLREDCTAAKEALSSDTETTITVALPGLSTQVRVTREELEAMVRPRLGETVSALRAAISSAGLELDDVSAILLVGGTARIPLVAEFVTSESGRPVAIDAHPKLVVALGAAALSAGGAASAGPAADVVDDEADGEAEADPKLLVVPVVPVAEGDKAAAAAAAADKSGAATAGATAPAATAAGGAAGVSATTAPSALAPATAPASAAAAGSPAGAAPPAAGRAVAGGGAAAAPSAEGGGLGQRIVTGVGIAGGAAATAAGAAYVVRDDAASVPAAAPPASIDAFDEVAGPPPSAPAAARQPLASTRDESRPAPAQMHEEAVAARPPLVAAPLPDAAPAPRSAAQAPAEPVAHELPDDAPSAAPVGGAIAPTPEANADPGAPGEANAATPDAGAGTAMADAFDVEVPAAGAPVDGGAAPVDDDAAPAAVADDDALGVGIVAADVAAAQPVTAPPPADVPAPAAPAPAVAFDDGGVDAGVPPTPVDATVDDAVPAFALDQPDDLDFGTDDGDDGADLGPDDPTLDDDGLPAL